MKKFMGNDFLLQNHLAQTLFEEVKNLPIIDYHCHLNPREIAENKKFENITQMWLGGDHYKWRLMRAAGIPEEYITGTAPDYEKFSKWAEAIEECIGNPVYHWTHLELKRIFGYEGVLSPATAAEAWEKCNSVIRSDDFCPWHILDKFHVETLCTTDDPADSLEYHMTLARSGLTTRVLPTFRPGKAYAIENTREYRNDMERLSQAADVKINNYSDLVEALYKRIDFFHEMGCRLSDHSLEPPVFEEYSAFEMDVIVRKAMDGKTLDEDEINKYKTALLIDLGEKYGELGWTMQFHMLALRNNNSLMFERLGADTGFDSMDDVSFAKPLSRLLNALSKENKLPKTILYTLNPTADNMIAAMAGNFQGGGVKSKIQFGSGWWYNDTITGMERQMTVLANLGLLSGFVGMLTDSRSFLSYPRHEYFRRILCGLVGKWVENGEFPDDLALLGRIVKNISYYNAKEYFAF